MPAILSVTRLSWKAWQNAFADREFRAVLDVEILARGVVKLALAR